MGTCPDQTAAVRAVTTIRLPTSQTRISRRRSTRSAITPPGSIVISTVPTDTVPMAPACTADPVSLSTSSGRARALICPPRTAKRPLSQSSRKSLLPRSGVVIVNSRGRYGS